MRKTSSKTSSIRKNLESDFHKNHPQHFQNKQLQHTSKKKYLGLKLNWKDAVILTMTLFFTSLYQAQSFAQELFNLENIDSGMMLNYHSETNNYSSIQLLNSEYEVDIKGMVAYISVKQKFYNQSPDWIEEGMYAFPIEHTGAVYHMRLKIGDRLIEGEIHEKQQAEKIYQQAKSEGLSASIVKQFRPNLFTTEVANIMPNEIVEVEIQYQQILRYDSGQFDFRLPLKIKPRYFNSQNEDTLLAELPLNNITDSIQRSIRVNLEAGFELNQLESKYHRVEIADNGTHQVITFKDQSLEDNHDFVLQWKPRRGSTPKAAFFSEYFEGEKYVLAMMLPPQTSEKTLQKREMIFVIDTSGSMHGKALNQAKDALYLAVSQLTEVDSFNLIEFNSHARELFSQSMAALPENLDKAIDFIDSLISTGGTNMAPAFSLALDDQVKEDHLKQIIFITDGSVGNEAQLFQQINQDIGNARLFTVAIGQAPNNYFMNKASEIGRGNYTHIGDLKEVDQSINDLFKKLSHPAMTDIIIDWNSEAEQSPKVIPDLYLDQPLFVTAKMKSSKNNIEVMGNRGKSTWNREFNFNKDGQTAGIAKLWARHKIDGLNDDYMLGGNVDFELLKNNITELALKFNLVSQFTSLVAVDKNPDLSRKLELQAKALKASSNIDSAHYPQTFTGWKLQLIFGFLLIILSLSFRRIKA